ncbi:MAG: tRNA (adenine-N1)-methyltransferase [Desulfurococcaceae archaeon TW002]
MINEGDLVLIYVDERRSKVVRVVKGKILHTDRGYLKLDDLVGLEWGSKVRLSTGVTAYVLKPMLVDLMFKSFKRVTQVIYPKDLAYMVILSGIGEGSRVAEAGVGTGFLTAVLAWVVGSGGHVYGYEINKEYIDIASRNLELAGLTSRVTLKNKDITQGIDEQELDAIFLDMPNPWDVFPHLQNSLKPSGSLVIFVPTVNQVLKILSHIREFKKLTNISVTELMLREYQVSQEALRPKSIGVTHTGYIITSRFVKEAP